MSIGLYDADIATYGQAPFNLEIMKLSSYYKSKREIVVFSKELNPQRYSKFFYRKDYYDGTYPTEIAKEKNVVLDGYAFHPDNYIPMDVDIERRPADKSIYKKYADFFIINPKTKEKFSSMFNATHLRLSLDGAHLFNKFEDQIIEEKNKAFFLHDLNPANIDGAREVIEDLRKLKQGENEIRIGTKFPIKIYEPEVLKKWTSFPTMKYYYPIHYYGLLSDEDFINLFKTESKNILTQFVYYPLFNEDIKESSYRAFVQMNYARALGRPIIVRAQQVMWDKVFQFLTNYTKSQIGFNKRKPYLYFTPYNYASKKKKYIGQQKKLLQEGFSVEEIREIFLFVQKENYELFKLFYECAHSKPEGGHVIPCVG